MSLRVIPAVLCAALLVLAAPVRAADPPQECAAPTAVSTSVPQLLDIATYRIHTIAPRPNGSTLDRTINAVVAVPTNVDATGDLLPDFTVTLLPTSSSSAKLTIARTLFAPARLPARVEAIVDATSILDASFGYDARTSNAPQTLKAAFSFSFRKPVPGVRNGTRTDLGLSVTTTGASDSVNLVAGLDDTSVPRGDTSAAIGLAPVPGFLGAQATITCAGFTQTTQVHVDASAPTRVDATVRDVASDGTTAARAVIDRLPSSVDVQVLDDRGARTQTVTSSGNATIGVLDLTADTIGVDESLQREVRARVEDVPKEGMEVVLAKHGEDDTRLSARTLGASLRSVEGGSAERHPVEFLTDPAQFFAPGELGHSRPGYALVPRAGDVAVRVNGLRSALIDTADPLSAEPGTLRVEATSQAQPFLVRQLDGSRTVNARVLDLPASVKLTIAKDAQVYRYTAGAPIDHVHVVATDPNGLVPRTDGLSPTVARLDVDGVPTCLELAVPQTGLGLATDHGVSGAGAHCLGDIAHVDALLGTGSGEVPSPPEDDDAIDPSEDGLSITDRPDRFTLQARLTDIAGASLSAGKSTQFMPVGTLIDHGGDAFDETTQILSGSLIHGADVAKPFQVHIERGADRQYLDTRLASIPQSIEHLAVTSRTFLQHDLIQCTPGLVSDKLCETTTDIDWLASGPIAPTSADPSAIVLDTNMGDRSRPDPQTGEPEDGQPNMSLQIATLPAHVHFCTSTMRDCGFFATPPRIPGNGQMLVDAGQPMHVRMFDCRFPGADGTCTPKPTKDDAQVSSFADIEDVQNVKFQSTIPPIFGGQVGHIYLDTRDGGGTAHAVNGTGLDLFTSSLSNDPCNTGETTMLEGEIRDVSAVDKLMDFETANLLCQPTEINVKAVFGSMHCGDDFRLDGNPGGIFGRIDNDLCHGGERG